MLRTRVLVAEHSDSLREGLVALLDRQPDLVVTGAVPTPEHALETLMDRKADVVVLDDEMPGREGVLACAAIARGAPGASVVVLSRSTSDTDIAAYLGAGARGYVLKGTPAEEVVSAVRRVGRGRLALPPKAARRLLDAKNPVTQPSGQVRRLFSKRRKEVM